MGTMCGCSRAASMRASERKRLRTLGSAPNSGGNCLMATSRFSDLCRPASTMPQAPRPSSPCTSYRGKAAATRCWSGPIRCPHSTRRYGPGMAARLRVRLNGRDFEFDGQRPVTVGRDPGADVLSSNPVVSREHLVLVPQDSRWVLEDRGSRGGTYVDGQRVTRLDLNRALITVRLGDLQQGDELQLMPDLPVAETIMPGHVPAPPNATIAPSPPPQAPPAQPPYQPPAPPAPQPAYQPPPQQPAPPPQGTSRIGQLTGTYRADVARLRIGRAP